MKKFSGIILILILCLFFMGKINIINAEINIDANFYNLMAERYTGKINNYIKERDNNQNYYSPLTGIPYQQKNNQIITAAVIENSLPARPQTGLDQAEIIYEFMVEGGITRFVALYWQQIPDRVGPIRSIRSYMLQIIEGYDPLVLHAGSSPGGYQYIKENNINNLDQIYNSKYYLRSNDRQRPHNLYTSSRIKEYIPDQRSSMQLESRFTFQPAAFIKHGAEKAERIIINYWGNYKIIYIYNDQQNNYKRFLYNTDIPHLNAEGKQLKAKNVIVMFTKTFIEDDVGRLNMDLGGEGEFLFFKNGVITAGKWKKQEDKKWTKFYDNSGKEINVNPGQTWIQVVPLNAMIEW